MIRNVTQTHALLMKVEWQHITNLRSIPFWHRTEQLAWIQCLYEIFQRLQYRGLAFLGTQVGLEEPGWPGSGAPRDLSSPRGTQWTLTLHIALGISSSVADCLMHRCSPASRHHVFFLKDKADSCLQHPFLSTKNSSPRRDFEGSGSNLQPFRQS